ncbi:MAG: hypothetical protein BAJALOKI2v1_890006 [Promethearchaeota archaeon]|nr:MAG: hypothetical protein BAJALOKI2v1_890006 [Candidatus Lokiarchaeota archaeon]
MSTEKGFVPLTSQLGIPGTSYRLQLGLINEKWASRILKGKNVIDSYVYKEEDISKSGVPNQNMIVGYVLRTVAIPNINPHQVMKTTQALVKQAITNKDKKKAVAPVSETKEVELEKVPQSEIKRPKSSGWVKEEDHPPVQSEEGQKKPKGEEDMREAFKDHVKHKEGTKTVKTKRELPQIPSGDSEGEVTTEKKEEASHFCPYCGKDLNFKYCPFCGEKLPHD